MAELESNATELEAPTEKPKEDKSEDESPDEEVER